MTVYDDNPPPKCPNDNDSHSPQTETSILPITISHCQKPSPPPQNNGHANDVAVGYDGEARTVEYFVDADFDDKHGDGDDSVDNHRRRRRRPRHYHRRRDHSPRASQTISIANLAIILRLHHPQRSAKREQGVLEDMCVL